eukprot:3846848-Prorocentrum_lima.AAC.1
MAFERPRDISSPGSFLFTGQPRRRRQTGGRNWKKLVTLRAYLKHLRRLAFKATRERAVHRGQ